MTDPSSSNQVNVLPPVPGTLTLGSDLERYMRTMVGIGVAAGDAAQLDRWIGAQIGLQHAAAVKAADGLHARMYCTLARVPVVVAGALAAGLTVESMSVPAEGEREP